MNTVYSSQRFFTITLGAAIAAVLFLGAWGAPRAQAATLTQSQINAIVLLLQAFNADASVIENVKISLEGKKSGGSTKTSTETTGAKKSSVERSATLHQVDGADNDYATFSVSLDFNAFGEDAYISTLGTDAFTYQVEDASTGTAIGGATAVSATVSSSADVHGGAYLIKEGDKERFTFTVNFNPLPGDESKSYRMQLLSVSFDDEPDATGQTWSASPQSKYETDALYIND